MRSRTVIALGVSASIALSPVTATANPSAAAPVTVGQNGTSLHVGDVTVPVTAAVAAVAGIGVLIGGALTVAIQVLLAAGAEKNEEGVSSSDLPSAEYVSRFDFSATEHDPAIGGLSGMDQLEDGRYIAISDDKHEHGPIRAYIFTTQDHRRFAHEGEVRLTLPDGSDYTEFIDAEEIRQLPNGNLLWTTEGDAREGQVAPPQLIESTAAGREVRRINPPAYHFPDGHDTKGIHHNNGPEAMTLADGGTTALTINENALAQDGTSNDPKHSSVNRITEYNLANGNATHEYAVRANPGRGITSVLEAEDGSLYVLERGFYPELGKSGEVRGEIYRLTLSGADDVLGKDTLDGTEQLATKELVYDFADNPPQPDNVEALSWGPMLDDGRRTLHIAVDDNFSDTQSTLFHTVLVP
ncbi:esterase-like activity of phytase family protein [Corynebacterium hadale]